MGVSYFFKKLISTYLTPDLLPLPMNTTPTPTSSNIDGYFAHFSQVRGRTTLLTFPVWKVKNGRNNMAGQIIRLNMFRNTNSLLLREEGRGTVFWFLTFLTICSIRTQQTQRKSNHRGI